MLLRYCVIEFYTTRRQLCLAVCTRRGKSGTTQQSLGYLSAIFTTLISNVGHTTIGHQRQTVHKTVIERGGCRQTESEADKLANRLTEREVKENNNPSERRIQYVHEVVNHFIYLLSYYIRWVTTNILVKYLTLCQRNSYSSYIQ